VVVAIAGIIASAVGDELVIAHPYGHTETAWLLVIIGGPALFVAGQALIQLAVVGTVSRSSLVGLVAFAILAPTMASAPPLAAVIAATTVLLGCAAFDTARDWTLMRGRVLRPSAAAEEAGSSAS
jgi:low temperature requirement protein LtrA